MIIIKRIGILTLLLSLTLSLTAQTGVTRAQALFIYNFSRLINWPADYKSGPFVIGVMGSGSIFNELQTYTNGKTVGSQKIVVKVFASPDAITTCHTLVVPFSQSKKLPLILTKLEGKSTLIVTEKNGSIQKGAGINFVVIGDKLKFEYGPNNITSRNITVSSKLGEMAYKVY